MIVIADLAWVLGVEMHNVENWIKRDEVPATFRVFRHGRGVPTEIPEEDAFRFSVFLILAEALGIARACHAMTDLVEVASFLDVYIGCTTARFDLRPIRAAISPLVRQAA